MNYTNRLYDYNVKLLGLLPINFDFTKDENNGITFQTHKLKKIKKPSEDRHDGQVVISDEKLLSRTAVAESKIIHRNTKATNSNPKKIVDEVTTLANEVAQKVKVDDGCGDGKEVVNKEIDNHKKNIEEASGTREDVGENDRKQMESDDKPVDKILNEEHPARFLYKSFYNVGERKPDFISYRLPLMHLAIKTDPYFFKVTKIKFKPYDCDEEMEFIQMLWPIHLDDLYEYPNNKIRETDWSGPMFNNWATKECDYESASSHREATSSSQGDNAEGDNTDFDIDYLSTYHHAYLQAEIKPKTGQNKSVDGFSNPTRGFNVFMTAAVGGVWKLEQDPKRYTCQHLAEMRTVKEETVRYGNQSFYKRVRMLSNYWQCYLAGETSYLVGVNGFIQNDGEEQRKREIKELRLYDVSKIPAFIRKCGAEQGFIPWSKEVLENRLYNSLCVIYDKVIDAPVDTEFMFVKYNEFDPPVHDIDGSIARPYLLAFKQLIIEGLSTPNPQKLVIDLMKVAKYAEAVKYFLERKFKREDLPAIEAKESCLVLTFESELLAKLFRMTVESYMESDEFPIGSGFENLKIKKITMQKPVAASSGFGTQTTRNSNRQEQHSTFNNGNGQRQQYSRQFFAPSRSGDMNSNRRQT